MHTACPSIDTKTCRLKLSSFCSQWSKSCQAAATEQVSSSVNIQNFITEAKQSRRQWLEVGRLQLQRMKPCIIAIVLLEPLRVQLYAFTMHEQMHFLSFNLDLT